MEKMEEDFNALQKAYNIVKTEKETVESELQGLVAENASLRSGSLSPSLLDVGQWQCTEQGWEGESFAQFANPEDFSPTNTDPQIGIKGDALNGRYSLTSASPRQQVTDARDGIGIEEIQYIRDRQLHW